MGACNPSLANQALEAETDVGLLLPCNVVVYAADVGTTVVALDPRTMVSLTHNAALEAVAEEAGAKLEHALSAVEGA